MSDDDQQSKQKEVIEVEGGVEEALPNAIFRVLGFLSGNIS